MLTSMSQPDILLLISLQKKGEKSTKLVDIYGRMPLCHKVVSYYVLPFVV